MSSVTIGIDLASQAKSTALCAIRWDAGSASVETLVRGTDDFGTPLHDEVLSGALEGLWGGIPQATKVSIDAPLGWPTDFIRAVGNQDAWPVHVGDSRARLLRRATDTWVHEQTGKQPLSVSSDKIAYPAMRAAGLLSHFQQRTGMRVDRTGATGLICEVYPDPAIRAFDLWPPELAARASYKGTNATARLSVVDRLLERAPWLTITDDQAQACVDFDDNLDALVCALVARAVEVQATHEIPGTHLAEARQEGWIHIPVEGSLQRLIDAPRERLDG